MQQLEIAILRTILYGDIFDFPMTLPEIHHFLIHNKPTGIEAIETALNTSEHLRDLLVAAHGYYARAERAEIIDIRLEREHAAQHMWRAATMYGRWLARLPFVRMVALTGALAMRNAKPHDDFDYLLVTAPGRVWLGRAFAIALVYLGKLNGNTICPNYILAEDTLEQSRKNLYIAHEMMQMVPLYGHRLYRQMRDANPWAEAALPNATQPYYEEPAYAPGGGWKLAKRAVEFLLGGQIGTWLEQWERNRKIKRFQQDLQTPQNTAQLDSNQVKGHFQDYGHIVLEQYDILLKQYDLVDVPHEHAVSGD